MKVDYQINPALMGGIVKNITDKGLVHINLNGRLGVFEVTPDMILDDTPIEPGHCLQFYFSYIQVSDNSYEYDVADLNPEYGMTPTLVGGVFTQVNDSAIEAEIMDGMGTVAVPRRWVFTEAPLEEGQGCEFYFSRMKIVNKIDLPTPESFIK